MKRLRKLVKKILQSWRKFRRRKLKKNIKEEEMFQDVLASYKIYYDTSNKNHEINMELITKIIDGLVIFPNETFSFNENVGERTVERGFKEGPVYVKGEVIRDLAGGICQVVTGLYNLALLSNMQIIERKHHPIIQRIAPAGRDATIYYGLIDLIFKNKRKSPIKLSVYLNKEEGRHIFEILGRNIEKINVKIKSEMKERKNHLIVTTYREIYKGERRIKKQKISEDKYRKY